jgi:small subunit ribosomal protein S18
LGAPRARFAPRARTHPRFTSLPPPTPPPPLLNSRLRLLDAQVIARQEVKTPLAEQAGLALVELDVADKYGVEDRASPIPPLGLPIDYCIFCYHGTGIMRHDNTTLLTRLVSDRGAILPARFTRCCKKHQRRLSITIRRARALYLLPVHAKLHPRARFPSLRPPRPTPEEAAAAARGEGGGAAQAPGLLEELSRR